MTNRLFYLKYDFLSAFQHFKTKWIHSLLSLLGIIISIGSIIIMISISDGAKQKTLNNIKDLGINSIRIINKPLSNISNKNFNLSSGLNIRDYNLINNIIKKYGYSSMVIKLLDSSIYFNGGDTSGLVVGTNENFHLIEQLKIIKGRAILKSDISEFRQTAVISKDIAFKYSVNIGDNVKFANNIFTIVGIIDTKDNLKNFVLTPFNVIKNHNNKTFNEINIYIEDKNQILLIANKLADKINQKHNNIDNFIINIPLKIIKKEEATQSIFNTVLLTIALMSLLTGGISVMNAVLSNINEQTREIGLKVALGATQNRIIRFYLLYTTLLTVIGGIFGGIFGYVVLLFLFYFTNLYIIFSMKAFILGIAVSILSGLIFGIYPAIRASKIEPIIALKEY